MAESDPQETAVLIFAHFLGIDIETEHHLLYIAQDALSVKGLPKGWELGIGDGDNDGIPYFFNTETEESVWNHPKEAIFIRKVKEEKEKDKRRKANEERRAKDAPTQKPAKEEKRPQSAEKREEANPAAKPVAKEDPALEVQDFEEVMSPDPKSSTATASASASGSEAIKSKDGVVTANSNNGTGFGMQPTDFFAADDDDTPVKKTIGATTTTTNAKSGAASTAAAATAKPVKATRSASTSSNWANEGKASKPKDASPPNSPGSLPRVDGPPVSSRSLQGGDRDRDRDHRTNNSRNERDRERPSTAQAALGSGYDRENKDRESARERDMRERESKRERERERDDSRREETRREREREAREREREFRDSQQRERGPQVRGRDREMEAELSIERRRADDERRRGDLLDKELESLRDKHRRLEEQLEEELADRREAEERVYRLQSETDERLRDTSEKWEERVREASRTGRQEIEQEWRERFKTTERRNEEDLQEARDEVRASKVRAEDAIKEMDALRRRVSESREDGKLEAKLELEKLRSEVDEYEAKSRAQGLELRRLREEHVDVGSRLAAALQAAQVAQAEGEAARSQAASIVAEGKSSHTALVQATNRIQSLDSDCAKLKAENLLHRREIDAQQAEMRKLQAATGVSTDQLNMHESETRRAKAMAQSEVVRLSSKLSEQEAVLEVLRAQLDKAQEVQFAAVRDVEKQLDRSVFDNHRLAERVKDLEGKVTNSSARCQELEKELIIAQDGTFRVERTLREEQQKQQTLTLRLEQQRATFETELVTAREALHQQRLAENDIRTKHRDEIEAMKRDVAERIPKISQAAAERLEGHYQTKIEQEVGGMRARHEVQIQALKRELVEMSASQAEREARQRAAIADERAELERLKGQSARQLRQIGSLETDLDDALLAVRRNGGRASLLLEGTNAPSGTSEAKASTEVHTSVNVSALNQEDEASFTAAAQLQGQLQWMKQQLNLALESTADKKIQRGMGEPQSQSQSQPQSHQSPHYNRYRAAPHVTFSPESLFASPNPAATTGSKARNTLNTQRPDKTSTAPKSVFGHIRFQGRAEGEEEGEDGEGDDGGLPYGATVNQSAIERSYANYNTGDEYMSSTAAMRAKSSTLQEGDEEDFDGIQDGGFHEGYWKARYAKGK